MRGNGVIGPDASRPQLVLWQTEWCPASHRVRQRLTELGLDVVLRQVPVERDERDRVRTATGETSVPILVADGEVVAGEEAIVTYLDSHFPEPSTADAHRAKAARARARDLEEACRQLTRATH
jgi:glutathione S-transferase